MSTDFMKKNANNFHCNLCDFITCKKNNYEIHINTKKHISNTLASNSNMMATKKILQCDRCNKIYNDRSGLWRHNSKGKCFKPNISYNKNEIINEDKVKNNQENLTDKDLIMILIKENSELKNMMMKVLENGTNHNNNSHNITNSHNKSFNLQFFLNETCKDAMNITDFIDSLKLQVSDLERVGEVGYIEGISRIIIKNLKEMDITQRPVHCTDKKRETLYIKDEDKWEKDEEKKKMHKMIRKVADKNARLLPKFKEKYPDYNKASSSVSDQFNKIIVESMGGSGDNDYEKEEKIIRNISKQIIIDK